VSHNCNIIRKLCHATQISKLGAWSWLGGNWPYNLGAYCCVEPTQPGRFCHESWWPKLWANCCSLATLHTGEAHPCCSKAGSSAGTFVPWWAGPLMCSPHQALKLRWLASGAHTKHRLLRTCLFIGCLQCIAMRKQQSHRSDLNCQLNEWGKLHHGRDQHFSSSACDSRNTQARGWPNSYVPCRARSAFLAGKENPVTQVNGCFPLQNLNWFGRSGPDLTCAFIDKRASACTGPLPALNAHVSCSNRLHGHWYSCLMCCKPRSAPCDSISPEHRGDLLLTHKHL